MRAFLYLLHLVEIYLHRRRPAENTNHNSQPAFLRVDFFNGHKGCLWLTVTTCGRPAHASSPWKGVNAFDKMVGFVDEINKRIKPNLLYREDAGIDVAAGGSTGTITLGGIVSSGTSPNVVPPQCTMTIDRRLAPGEDVATALEGFSSILRSLQKADHSFEYDIKMKSQYEACLTPPQSHLVRTLEKVLQAVNGQAPRALMMTAGCDMRYFHAAGIPTVIYGPADLAMAYQTDEYVELDRVVAAAQVYALTAMRLLGVA